MGRKLPPDGFYNVLISEKMDVQVRVGPRACSWQPGSNCMVYPRSQAQARRFVLKLTRALFCSQDHYTAWRQTQDQPSRRHGTDGPFSFCRCGGFATLNTPATAC